MDLKSPITFNEQVKKLKEHGMEIVDEQEAERILSQINYYRFTGYALQFRKEADNSDYIDGLSFEKVLRIYRFDEALRDIFRKYIERVELYYRTLISYHFSLIKCSVSPHDQHYDENNFYKKQGYREVMNSFEKERNYYKDSLIVKHHKIKYDNKMPLWVIVELMSFSNISKFYSAMYMSDQAIISAQEQISPSTLKNHLHCLSVLRNKCAHAARLYNTEFFPPATFTKQYLRNHPEINNKSLFAYVLVLSKRLPEEKMGISLVRDISAVIEEYSQDIDLSAMGFPVNFEELLNNR